jgi:hypothetical protein
MKLTLLPISIFRANFGNVLPPQIHTIKVSNILVTLTTIGRTVAPASGCRLLTAKASVQLPDRPYGICIEHTATGFCPSEGKGKFTLEQAMKAQSGE